MLADNIRRERAASTAQDEAVMKSHIRKILVPLDPSKYADSATRQACRIALAHDARVAGMVILDMREIQLTDYPYGFGYAGFIRDEIGQNRERLGRKADETEEKFSRYCKEQGVDAIDTEFEGVALPLILEAATLFDLMVIGLKTHFHFDSMDDEGKSLIHILERTSTPILAVPAEDKPLKRALIAYDGSPSSARALRDFTLFAEHLDLHIDLFLADENGSSLDFHANKALLYLSDHGLKIGKTIRKTCSATQALKDRVADDYDVIVCGMHSRKVVKDIFVGSFTKQLIEAGDKCLFLSH